MSRTAVTIIDEHAVVACSPADAAVHLSEPAAIAAWFGGRYGPGCTIVEVDRRTLEFRHDVVQERHAWSAVVVDGTVSGRRYHAYLTIRAVIRVGDAGQLHEAAEIWAHVEVASAPRSTTKAIRSLLRRGLDHLRLELDAGPGG